MKVLLGVAIGLILVIVGLMCTPPQYPGTEEVVTKMEVIQKLKEYPYARKRVSDKKLALVLYRK